MTSIENKVVVVTGGSRGLGRVMSESFASCGANVVVASRKMQNCEDVVNGINSKNGGRALAVGFNVSDWSDCDRLVEAAYAEFGRIDVLVNNAGMSLLYPSLDKVDEAHYDKVMGVNLKGPFRLSAVIGTRMAETDGGSIINISSVAAIRPDADTVPYAAAKAGLEALTVGMSRAFAPRVRVNTIQCGPFLTDIAEAWTAELRSHLEDSVALGRCGEPEEVLGAAHFFASDASSYCTGAVLRLDGGMR